jgi:hypothetical protein
MINLTVRVLATGGRSYPICSQPRLKVRELVNHSPPGPNVRNAEVPLASVFFKGWRLKADRFGSLFGTHRQWFRSSG